MRDNPAPTLEMLKKMKLDSGSTLASTKTEEPPANVASTARRATVEDADVDLSFAPGEDADYFTEEDNEGRFFGGGLTSEQKDILNIFDKAGGEGIDEVRCISLLPSFDILIPDRLMRYLLHKYGNYYSDSNALSTKIKTSDRNILTIPQGSSESP